MTIATTASSTGAAIAIFRRTARSCAAPLACHAAQRSSNVADPATGGVDVGVAGDATTAGTPMPMCPSRRKALVRAGPVWPRAQKSRSSHSIRSRTVSLDFVTRTFGRRDNSPCANAASQSETREMRADDAVALARGRFESLSVQDLDPPVAARDQPVALEGPQDNSDGGTLHAEHHGEELLLEGEGIVLDAVARLEQPATGPLGDFPLGASCRMYDRLHSARQTGATPRVTSPQPPSSR
jgi:hypothetical protein